MSEQEKTLSELLGQFVVLLAFAAAGCALQGWCIATIWNWHATTILSMPAVSVWGAIGLACLVSVFRWPTTTNRSEFKLVINDAITRWIGYGLCVLIAYWAT